MTEKFWSFFWDNLNKAFFLIATLISFIFSFIADDFLNYPIKLRYVVLETSISVIIIAALYLFSTKLYSKYTGAQQLPENKNFAKIFKVIDMNGSARDGRAKAVFLIKSPTNFLEGDLVSFYYNYCEGLEHLVGFGLITNVGENMSQIELSYIFKEHQDTVNKLIDNNKEVIDNMTIKSRIPEKNLVVMINEVMVNAS